MNLEGRVGVDSKFPHFLSRPQKQCSATSRNTLLIEVKDKRIKDRVERTSFSDVATGIRQLARIGG